MIFGGAVLDARRKIFAAMRVSVPIARCSVPRRKAIVASLKKASAAITADLARLGYRAPEPETTVRKLEIGHAQRLVAAG